MTNQGDVHYMRLALEQGDSVRRSAAPNPWVGAVLVDVDGNVFTGSSRPKGGRHAEAVAIDKAKRSAEGSTVYTTLEPCSHHGKNPPCADALIDAGVRRVVVGIRDPDKRVSGTGIARLRDAGIEVEEGVLAVEVVRQLRPYLHHRSTGRPFVVLKMAATLDGRTCAPDGSSKWITGEDARGDVQILRAESDAIVVGRRTVVADDPTLDVRLPGFAGDQPLRVVLGAVPQEARVRPALVWQSELTALLDELGSRGCMQVLVEGGARVAGEFHRQALVDRYVFYVAPSLLGGDDGGPVMSGPGAPSMSDIWRGKVVESTVVGDDVKIVVEPADSERMALSAEES